MKKKLLAILSVLCLMFSLTACGGGGSESEEGDAITIRVAHVSAPGGKYDAATTKFKELVEEGSDGRITVNIYHGDMTTDEIEGTEMVQTGNLEIFWPSMGALSGFNPISDVFQLPFLFEDDEHLENVLNGEAGEMVLEELSTIENIEAIAFHQDGWRNITTTGRVINSLEDVKGAKIRCMQSDMLVDMYESIGSVPTAISYSELYTALQTGLVEGQDNDLETCLSDGYGEVLSTACMNNLFYAGGVVIVSEEWLNSLSEEDQQLIRESAKEAGAYQRQWQLDKQEEMIEYWEGEGWTITYPEDTDDWKAATQEVFDKYVEKNGWEDIIELIEAAK